MIYFEITNKIIGITNKGDENIVKPKISVRLVFKLKLIIKKKIPIKFLKKDFLR